LFLKSKGCFLFLCLCLCLCLSLCLCLLLVSADVCWRMLTYADVCWRRPMFAEVCWGMLTSAEVCWRESTLAALQVLLKCVRERGRHQSSGRKTAGRFAIKLATAFSQHFAPA
jgi:hypothetical protein